MWRNMSSPFIDPFDQSDSRKVSRTSNFWKWSCSRNPRSTGEISDGSGRLWSDSELDDQELLPARPAQYYPPTRMSDNFPSPGTMPRRLSLPSTTECQIRFGNEEIITHQIRLAQMMRQNTQIRKNFLYFALAATFLTIMTTILALKLFIQMK